MKGNLGVALYPPHVTIAGPNCARFRRERDYQRLVSHDFMHIYSVAIDVIRGCWLTFAIVWLLAAVWTKRSVYRESRSQRLGYTLPIVAAYFLLINGGRMLYPLNLRVVPRTAIVAWAGMILCLAGLGFAIWARVVIGRNWSGTVTLKEDHQLIERGPYRLVRHPIYTGILSMFVATAILLGHLAGSIGVVIVFASFWSKLIREEKVMLNQFPDKYGAYRQRVKRLIPFVL
jgi:protein-S-isoprenylcysteine O-methyltransferase Ste14